MNIQLPVRASSRRTKPSARLVLTLLSLLPVIPLAAQTAAPASPAAPVTAPAPKDDIVELSPFSVSADNADRYRAADAVSAVRVRAALIDTPSSISVITRDMMDDLAPNRVFDVTKYVAGVQEGRGIQFQDRMIIRGFETQNGARSVDNFLQSADADNVEEAIIDRIEVTKGPNAILSPAGAPGGSLNIITKSPTFRAQNSITAQVGLYDSQKAMLDLGGPLEAGSSFAYRLVASGQDTANYWSSSAKMHSWAVAPMFTWRINDKSQLTVKYIYSDHWIFREPLFILSPDTTATSGNPKLLPGIDPSGLNGIQPWSHVGTNSSDAFIVYTTSFNEHLNLRVAGNARRYHETSNQNFLNAPGFGSRYNPMTGDLTQDYTWALQNSSLPYNATTNPYVSTFSPWINPNSISNRGDDQDTIRDTGNLQTDLAGNYDFGGMSTQTIVGAAYSRQYAYNQTRSASLPNIDLLHPADAYPAYPANWTVNNGSSYTNTQLYLSERLGLFSNRLYLTGGLMNYATVTKSWNELTHSKPAVLDDNKTMWSAGALYKITEHYSGYYSHSTNSSPVIANNQPLWRSGVQDEFGVKSEFFDKRLSINAAYFQISQTNVTVPNPAYQTDPTQPQTLVSDLSNKGFEIEVMGSVTQHVSVVGSYSHLHMRDALDRRVRMVADDNATMLVNYRFDDGNLKGLAVNFGVTYSGKRAGDVPSAGFTQLGVVEKVSFYTKPQYTTTLGASYRLDQHWMFRLNIDNLFDDADYVAVGGGRISGTGLTTQPGLNVRFSTTFSF
jgi:iron complex outermembrane receptor protein